MPLSWVWQELSQARSSRPSHSKTVSRQCINPIWNKSIMRQNSEQDDRSGTDETRSRQPSASPGKIRTPSMGYLQTPIIGREPSYTVNTSYAASPNGGSSSGQVPMSPSGSGQSTRSHSAGPSQDPHYTHVHPFGTHPSSMDGPPFTSYGPEFVPRTASPFPYSYGLEGLHSLTIPDGDILGHLSHEHWPSSASDSPYSTPDRPMIRGFDSPSADVADTFYGHPQYPSPQQHYPPEFSIPYSEETTFYDLQSHTFPVRDPTPPTVTLSAQPAENLVTLAHPVPDPPALLGRRKQSAALLGPYSGAAFLTASFLSPAALSAIPHYLDVYWKRFDTLFPLVHRRSLETAADVVLRCAMAAVGSQFLQSKEDRTNGAKLYDFASQEARRVRFLKFPSLFFFKPRVENHELNLPQAPPMERRGHAGDPSL